MPIDEEVLSRAHAGEPAEFEREWTGSVGVDEIIRSYGPWPGGIT